MLENLVLSLIAAVLGVVVAFAVLRTLVALAPPEVPRLALVAVNVRVLGLALAISTIVALAFGTIPLLQARRKDVRSTLTAENTRTTTGGPASGLMRAALVVGAGLLIKSFWLLQRVDPGFDPAGVLKAEFNSRRRGMCRRPIAGQTSWACIVFTRLCWRA